MPQASGAGRRFGPLCWLLLAPLLPFVYAFGFLFPRGDDFDEVTRAMFLFDLPGGLYEIGREWLTWSGRYTYHFLAVFLGKAGELRPAYGLVCAVAAALYGLAVYGLARESGVRMARRDAAFCAGFAILALFCCHQNLQTFYMLTDALTMGLQPALTFCFLWALCRLWRMRDIAQSATTRRAAIAAGVLAVGIYEHSAAAVALCAGVACLLAWRADRETKAGRNADTGQRLPDFLKVAAWCLGALLFSFLAPGNFYRKAVRHISPDVQWRQLCAAWDEWLRSAFWFFDGLWPWAMLALVFLIRRAQPARPLDESENTALQRKKALWLAMTAMAAYLLLSGGLTILHALSDVTISSSDKFPAGLSLYAACAFGFALHALLGASDTARRLIRRLPPWLPLLALTTAFCLSGNLGRTFVNAVNGNMTLLAETLSQRYGYLAALGATAAGADDPPKFGLRGEICRPDARNRRIDPALPQAVVQELPPTPVFPIHMGEALPGEAETWPNLWAAWMYGVGSVRSAWPEPLGAVRNARESVASTVLAVPPALQKRGVSAAWRVRAQGGPNITFADAWLVLRADGPLPENIAVLRPNPPDWRRLAPLPVQDWLLTRLLKQDHLKTGFCARLTGETLFFQTKPWRLADFYAFPLGMAAQNWPDLFLSLDSENFYRLPPP